jgi:hypothetical protein
MLTNDSAGIGQPGRRSLLRDLADCPEPASTIDIAAARRSGRRRLWILRGAISAAVAAVVALAVAVPKPLLSATGSPAAGGATIAPATSGTADPRTAPRSFCPTPAAVLTSATGPVSTARENGVSWRFELADQEKPAAGKSRPRTRLK